MLLFEKHLITVWKWLSTIFSCLLNKPFKLNLFPGFWNVYYWSYNCFIKHSSRLCCRWISSLWVCHQLCWYNLEDLLVNHKVQPYTGVWFYLQLSRLLCRNLPSWQSQRLHFLRWNLWLRHGIFQLLCPILLCWHQSCNHLWLHSINKKFGVWKVFTKIIVMVLVLNFDNKFAY